MPQPPCRALARFVLAIAREERPWLYYSAKDSSRLDAFSAKPPTPAWSELKRRGVRLLEVPEEEFARTQATNVLTVSPRRCIMLEGSPVTQGLLEDAGCEVVTFPGAPLSLKAEGGPTCLTRPVWRDSV